VAVVAALLLFGSAVLSFMLAWQVKHVPAEYFPVVRYNVLMLPLILAANVALATAFIRANEVVKNLPLVAAVQSFMYYFFMVVFTIFIVGEKLSVGRAVVGFSLMAAGIWILKK
jgi:hypothetical protein